MSDRRAETPPDKLFSGGRDLTLSDHTHAACSECGGEGVIKRFNGFTGALIDFRLCPDCIIVRRRET